MTKTMRGLLISTLVVAALPAFAEIDLLGTQRADPAVGRWVNGDGMTLYSFNLDTAGQSMCNDACALTWLPMVAGPDARSNGPLTVVARQDGTNMWALNGHPLYTFVSDTAKGDVNGHNVSGFTIVYN